MSLGLLVASENANTHTDRPTRFMFYMYRCLKKNESQETFISSYISIDMASRSAIKRNWNHMTVYVPDEIYITYSFPQLVQIKSSYSYDETIDIMNANVSK